MRIKAVILLIATVLIAVTPAKALDSKEEDLARVTTGMFIVGFLCPGYTPLADVLRYLGKRSVGEDRADKIMKAVGARITVRLPLDEPDAEGTARLDPAVSRIVDEALDDFLSRNDKEAACRQLGDPAVKEGFVERAH